MANDRPILISGGTLLHLDPLKVERGDVRIANGKITDVGHFARRGDERVVDVTGKWVMPGLVCGHHHLYSALACGMPFLPGAASSFTDMLRRVWWRLDRALDEDSVRASALTGGIDALRRGVTTVIDHHESPSYIQGSLETLDTALAEVGLRRILCYGVTNRGGKERAHAGIDAHRALLREGPRPDRAILVGIHASFTVDDDVLAICGRLAKEHGSALHVHVAEATDDEATTGRPLVERFAAAGALLHDSVFAHCVHLTNDELKRLDDEGITAAHQARSNLNNAVGHARIERVPVSSMLGTDGIGADMFAELQTAYFRAQEAMAPVGPDALVKLLAGGARYASRRLGVKLGVIEKDAGADLVVLDPPPGPPLTTENLAAAFVFRFSSAMVRAVFVGGTLVLDERAPILVAEEAVASFAEREALGLWDRMRPLAAE